LNGLGWKSYGNEATPSRGGDVGIAFKFMTDRIECSLVECREDAWHATDEILAGAKWSIDYIFEEGYAAKHPELVSAFLNASAVQYRAAFLLIGIQRIEGKLGALIEHFELSNR
jgi:hypothetical protein